MARMKMLAHTRAHQRSLTRAVDEITKRLGQNEAAQPILAIMSTTVKAAEAGDGMDAVLPTLRELFRTLPKDVQKRLREEGGWSRVSVPAAINYVNDEIGKDIEFDRDRLKDIGKELARLARDFEA